MKIAHIIPPPYGNTDIPLLGIGYINAALKDSHDFNLIDINHECSTKKPLLFEKLVSFYNEYTKSDQVLSIEPNFFKIFFEQTSKSHINYPFEEVAQWSVEICERMIQNSVRLVGLSVFESNVYFAMILIKHIKKITNIPIVLGGPFFNFTQNTRLFIKSGLADYIITGPGEHSYSQLATNLQDGLDVSNIPGIALMNGKVFQNSNNALQNTDSSRILPDFSCYASKTCIPLVTSTGCVYNCAFCSYKKLSPFTKRSVDNVIDEIQIQKKRYTTSKFYFCDSIINTDPSWLEEFCDKIIEKNIKIQWNAMARCQGLARKTINKMKLAGCCLLTFGIEHFHTDMQTKMNKKIGFDELVKTLSDCIEIGIKPRINIIIGFPGETDEQFDFNLKIIKALNNIYPRGFDLVYQPFQIRPLTDVFLQPEKYGINITQTDSDVYEFIFFRWKSSVKKEQIKMRVALFEKLGCELKLVV